MKTVASKTQGLVDIPIADNETSCLRRLNKLRHFIKTPGVIEKSRTLGSDTRGVPVLR